MMQSVTSSVIKFYSWWVMINAFLYYVEVDFLLLFAGCKKRAHILLYVLINSAYTAFYIYAQLPSIFSLVAMVLLFVYAAAFLKLRPMQTILPFIIIFTLHTVMEGFLTVFMRYLSLTLRSSEWGTYLHFILAGFMAVLLFLTFRFIAKRYSMTNQTAISSYLYILLLPCTFLVWGIRTILGLDRDTGTLSHAGIISGEVDTFLYAVLGIVGALVVFFIVLEVFHKITTLSQQEIDKALLAEQVKEQRGYIQEARQRNEGYRSFHHDIHNHLLVLSGLLNANEFDLAKEYLGKLHVTASSLSADVSTGNSVLDVLLWEKIRFAELNKITVVCDVQIPENSGIDDIDLCILFSNGFDNAIHACIHSDSEHKTIKLTGKKKHKFLLFDMVNDTDSSAGPVLYGTGLKNIRLTAGKYNGTMFTEKKQNTFRLSILLCFHSNMTSFT